VTDLIEGIIVQPDTWTPDRAASYITEAWQSAVDSIVETGRRLIEAKNHVGHGNWLPTVELLPFGKSAAEYLIQIAEHPDLSNSHHGGNLPASWRTLAVLAQLPAGEIPRRIAAGEITAELKRAAAEQMTAAYNVARQEALNAWSSAVDGLTAALSYAKTYAPPEGVPDNYLSVREFTERAATLLDIAQSWSDLWHHEALIAERSSSEHRRWCSPALPRLPFAKHAGVSLRNGTAMTRPGCLKSPRRWRQVPCRASASAPMRSPSSRPC
jgi:hypothetical protein